MRRKRTTMATSLKLRKHKTSKAFWVFAQREDYHRPCSAGIIAVGITHSLPFLTGVYDRGPSRTNKTEAQAVCEAILKHAREDHRRSLGVATFSIQQRQAIQDELELLRRESPDVESFFSAHPREPFFIKNLEN